MRVLRLRELGEPVEEPLDGDVVAEFVAAGVVSAERSAVPGRWLVRAGTKVGVARLRDVEVWVAPKIEIERLFFLLGYARNLSGWREETVPFARREELLSAVALAFERQAARATEQGLLQGYRDTEDSLPVLRGRLREAEQVRRRFGLLVPLEVRFDEFTVDIAENRLLRGAAETLLHLPQLPQAVRRGLVRLNARLADVSPLVRGRPRPEWRPTRLNARYHTALRLAEMILDATSLGHERGELRAGAFLFDMARIFEEFLSAALTEALAPYGGVVQAQDTTHSLDEAGSVRIRPDLVWYGDHGLPCAVIDAKYKAERPSTFPDADLYQLLAYCTALDLPVGHLVYAKGNELEARHMVRNCGVELVQHALDLSLRPAPLLEQVRDIAERIARTRAASAAILA
ncbi:MAG: McrC family protein [Actinomycetota bacterium]